MLAAGRAERRRERDARTPQRRRRRDGRCSAPMGGMDTVRALAERIADRDHLFVRGPGLRLPAGARSRAEDQGSQLHPRRGLRGGRTKARRDRAGRAGHALPRLRPRGPRRGPRADHGGRSQGPRRARSSASARTTTTVFDVHLPVHASGHAFTAGRAARCRCWPTTWPCCAASTPTSPATWPRA